MSRKRGQAWGFDLIVATSVFVGGILLFYLYSINLAAEGTDTLDKLQSTGNLISEDLFSEGFPLDWDSNNVERIGIVTDSRINQTKLERFYNISVEDYEKTKALFNTRYEYFISFQENISVGGEEIEGIGNKPEDPSNLIKINRVIVYDNKLFSIEVQVWE